MISGKQALQFRAEAQGCSSFFFTITLPLQLYEKRQCAKCGPEQGLHAKVSLHTGLWTMWEEQHFFWVLCPTLRLQSCVMCCT